ncbi:MAG: M16 family metallopeptidase [Candidatus Muiribacteriota bacterium]
MIHIKKIDGLTLIYEQIPHVKSISIGLWIKTGTAYENKFPEGISHFIEHMVFKGTKKRGPKKLAEELDSVGGYMNAFSSKEYTCFYSRLISEHIELAVDILSDITINSVYDSYEIEKEKEVVIEEIQMYEDNPDELVNDLINEIYWFKHPLGKNILGTVESVENITREDILEYVNQNYVKENVVISVAGHFDEKQIIGLIKKYFKNMKIKNENSSKIPDSFRAGPPTFIKKDIKQTHFCLAMPGPSQVDDDKYAFGILSSVIGGGMSSRLFQEIREKYGYVYTIYSYAQSHVNSGMFVVYFACSNKNTDKVIELVYGELKKIKQEGIKKEELERGKQQLKGNIILALENTSARMRRQASSLIYYNKLIELDEVIEKIDKVSMDDILKVSQKFLTNEKSTYCTVGLRKPKFNIEGVQL